MLTTGTKRNGRKPGPPPMYGDEPVKDVGFTMPKVLRERLGREATSRRRRDSTEEWTWGAVVVCDLAERYGVDLDFCDSK